MRKLATIRTIKEMRPIPEADAIETAIVDGWECVVRKSEGFKQGDLIVYIEIDSIVPERPEFEFLRDRKFKVKTIKLRKQISQGLVLPTSILPEGTKIEEGYDVTDILGVKKYDPEGDAEQKLSKDTPKPKNPVIKFLMRFKWYRKYFVKSKRRYGFPDWIVKTDEERIQNKTIMFDIEKKKGTLFIVTEKLDGSSLTTFVEKRGKKFDFGVCSRNVNLTNTPDNSAYWTIVRQFNIEGVLTEIAKLFNADKVVLQGEILGDGIQGNKYKINGYDLYAFNLIIDGKRIDTLSMDEILKGFGIKVVPIIDANFKLKDTIPDMVEYAKGDSVLLKRKREGIVLRNYDNYVSFKVINPEFLLEDKD